MVIGVPGEGSAPVAEWQQVGSEGVKGIVNFVLFVDRWDRFRTILKL